MDVVYCLERIRRLPMLPGKRESMTCHAFLEAFGSSAEAGRLL